MIAESIIRNLLNALHFEESNGFFAKSYTHIERPLTISLSQNCIYYDDMGIEVVRNTTSNFDDLENLVVLECVDRLLTKGYRPEHLILEPHWKVGHGASGGFGDILVKDKTGDNSYIIIECKVWGSKFDKELKDLKNNGGQLFTYFKEEPSTKWLTLYASHIEGNKIEYTEKTISVEDDANIVLLAKKNKTILLFSAFGKADELYNVWKETYGLKIWDNIVFSQNSQPYQVGIAPLRKKDLKDFTPNDKIVNRFEEILRHNNVSDRENAFNRLVALFICKLVDEIRKGDNDIVDFQYKQGTDTYETIQDRLQRLHKEGMEDFMKEEIFYVSEDYPDWLFTNYTGQRRKYAIEDLKRTIKILKFYSNNDFSFKDVHNEELFLQNGKILVEVVQLFENYRIVYPSKFQFLGDLFEKLLNNGFKQNEGQYFTPMPITRFIWDCLPIRKLLESSENHTPRIIDYACGAGHFLTEAVESINYFYPHENNSWVKDSIYGIEKDYRLARVAKISLFMNGAGEGNIIFGDGLDNSPEKGIANDSFDILVANPPYSVSGFKAHLSLKNNDFNILKFISNEGKDIETLFVERISQLVKPNGIAAVVLPVGLFTNDNNSANASRMTFIESFYIRAIVQLPGKTFGETGQNTNILFLQKYPEPPKQRDLIEDSVDAILANPSNLNDWNDRDICENYLNAISLSTTQYSELLDGSVLYIDSDNDYINSYKKSFWDLTVIKNRVKSKVFKRLSEEEQNQELVSRFSSHVSAIEKQKIFVFAISYDKQTCIITGPEATDQKNQFLGFKWSKRGGQEGIDIINYGGKLFNPEDREDDSQLSGAVRLSYSNEEWMGRDDVLEYVKFVPTSSLFDFSRPTFNNAISTSFRNEIIINSIYDLVTLGDVCQIKIGGTPSRRIHRYFEGNNPWVSIAEMNGQEIFDTKEKITDEAIEASNVKLIKKGSFLLSFKLSIGKTAIAGCDLYTNEAIAAIIPNNPKLLKPKFLFYLFKAKIIDLHNVDAKSFGKSVNSTFLRNNIKIPMPPVEVQDEIICKCQAIDDEYTSIRMTLDEYNSKIQQLFASLDIAKVGGVKLLDTKHFRLMIGRRILNRELIQDGTIPVYSANVFSPFGYVNHSTISDFSSPSVLWGIDGGWMVNYVPCDSAFCPTDHCGVLKVVSDDFNPHFVKFVLQKEGKKMGFSRSYRASLDRIESISIPKLPISIQNEFISKVEELLSKSEDLEKKLPILAEQQNIIIKQLLLDQ